MLTPIILLFVGLVCFIAIAVLVAQSEVASNVEGYAATVHSPIVPKEGSLGLLRRRLLHAGLYKKTSAAIFYVTQAILVAIPVLLAISVYFSGTLSLNYALLIGFATGIAGILFPGLWLDYRKTVRQSMIRKAVPDALDIATICVEAGLSLDAALIRVAKNLHSAYPMLAKELVIVNRHVQMGKTTGEALRGFAERFDLEELRMLASVVSQSERFGASIANALRVQGDSLRTRRMQRAQEKAQTATLKILFPTAFCIFPAIFVVILGPAIFDLIELLRRLDAAS